MSMKGLKFILILFFFSFPLSASDKIRVLIIHSYSQEYEWTKLQHNGFISALNAGNHTFEVYTEYLDTKRIKLTPSYIINFTNYLKMKYADAKPDLIYVTDDNALNFILENHSQLYKKDSYVPVFFSGVNNLNKSDVLPKNLFRGVFEKKEIKQNIELIKQFSPQTRKIYIVGDDSNTYDSIKKELTVEESNFSKMKFHYASDKYVSKVIEKLPKDEKIFVILATIGNLINDNNQTMLVQESIKTLKENRKLIILTMEDAYMRDGVVGGYVTSGERQGEEAAQLVLKYLKNKSLKEGNHSAPS